MPRTKKQKTDYRTARLGRDGLYHVKTSVVVGRNAKGHPVSEWHTATGATPDDAEEAADTWKDAQTAKVKKGTWSGADRATLAEWGRRWLEQVQGIKFSTWLSYDSLFRCYVEAPPADLPNVGRIPLLRLSADHLRDLYKAIGRRVNRLGNTDRKRGKALHAVLRNMLNDAQEDGLLTSTTQQHIVRAAARALQEQRKVKRKDPHAWTEDEQNRFLDEVDRQRPPCALFWYLFANTGARPNELLALRREDVDLQQRLIHITRQIDHWGGRARALRGVEWEFSTTKSEQGERVCAIEDELVPMFEAHYAAQDAAMKAQRTISPWRELVFTWQGAPVDWVNMRKREYDPLCQAAGLGTTITALDGTERFLPLSVPYNFGRHTLATRSHEAGIDRKTVTAQLGDATSSMVDAVYIVPNKTLEGTRAVSKAFGQRRFKRVASRRSTGTGE